jgi:chitinase
MKVISNKNRCGNKRIGSNPVMHRPASIHAVKIAKRLMAWFGGILVWALVANAYAVDCSTLPQWSSTTVYTNGVNVQRNLNVYRANWWNQGMDPVSHSGQWQEWTLMGVCDGVASSSASSTVARSSSSSLVSSSAISSSISSSVVSSSSSIGGSCASPNYLAGTSYA